ncbi:dihydroneopterin aldolase [Sphingobacterium sp. SYP-B4668]|uniref:dihydroneopterin aldolase n=1 Tax=Sphingobacterium sp. SYP-B4668 TaxID=2996035 RepID=UPI0022DDEE9D|nr:dihydroneopterin aldolase [Sphingobacterium sp. SYP-B4668]
MAILRQTIAINDARFYAPVGYYLEEQVVGNEFYVSVEVSYIYQKVSGDDLANTLNYEQLYAVIADVMHQKRALIESAVEEMMDKVLDRFDFLEHVDITVVKLNPLFGGDHAKSKIRLVYQRS